MEKAHQGPAYEWTKGGMNHIYLECQNTCEEKNSFQALFTQWRERSLTKMYQISQQQHES